jgi:hypothetical protein
MVARKQSEYTGKIFQKQSRSHELNQGKTARFPVFWGRLALPVIVGWFSVSCHLSRDFLPRNKECTPFTAALDNDMVCDKRQQVSSQKVERRQDNEKCIGASQIGCLYQLLLRESCLRMRLADRKLHHWLLID